MNEPRNTPHPDDSELLAARDHDDPAIRAHLAQCAACAAAVREAETLRAELRALPGFIPPPAVRGRITARLAASRRRAAYWRWPALAAATLLLILTTRSLRRSPALEVPATAVAGTRPPATGAGEFPSAADLPALISRSHALELALAAQPEPSALNGADAERIFRYEDGLTAIDQRLATLSAADPAAAKLWRKRADLLGGLIAARAPKRAAPALAQL